MLVRNVTKQNVDQSASDSSSVLCKANQFGEENENLSLIVKQTSLPGCDFLGLFATKEFPKGSFICKYQGKSLTTREAMRLEDKTYLMRLGEQKYVDAKDNLEVLAR